MMEPTEEQVMLTLAGLAYRGFHDVLPGEPHEYVVRNAVRDGLTGPTALAPVRDNWSLAWGPVTGRMPIGAFDSSAMFVVRSLVEPRRVVVSIRGTNPVASADWLFGDLWVATTVGWPRAGDRAAISSSTALGLATLQRMRWRTPSIVAELADATRRRIGGLMDQVVRSGRASLAGLTDAEARTRESLDAQTEDIVTHWMSSALQRRHLLAELRAAGDQILLDEGDLRQRWQPADDPDGGTSLLSYLRRSAEAARPDPLHVTVTGHSKGGALALATALWLAEARAGQGLPDNECWDVTGGARVRCVAFAGPTPGNTAFADRLDRVLGDDLVRVSNENDLVTRAWAHEDIRAIPDLYEVRSESLAPLCKILAASVERLSYAHPRRGLVPFAGVLNDARPLPVELVHQHMDAYLQHEGLYPQIDALRFFVG